MAWKRMFSFRATAAQDRPSARRSDVTAHPSSDSNMSAARGPATSDAASVFTATTDASFSSSDNATVERDAQPKDRSATASADGQASRPRSLDPSPPTRDLLQARPSHSVESLLLFNHSDDSRSTLSRSLRGGVRPRAPADAAATSKSADSLPRPHPHPQPKPRAKRREYTSYSYFVTPLVFTTANPYAMPPARPSSPLSTASSLVPQSAAAQSVASVESTPARDAAPPKPSVEEPASEPELPPAAIFKKITGTSRRRIFSRPSADGLTTLPSPGPTPPTLSRWRSEERPRPTTAASAFRPTRTQVDAGTSRGDINDPRSMVPPPAVTPQANVSVAAEERRLHIAVAKVKLDREVREERDVDEVLPKLRRLRAR